MQLLKYVSSYQTGGRMLWLYGEDSQLLLRGRQRGKTEQPEEVLEGHWVVEPVTLPLEVRNGLFEFEGLSGQKYSLSYTVSPQHKISLTESQNPEQPSTKGSSMADAVDRMFIHSLLQADSYKLGQVSFELFDSQH
jgi:hypothetical protein